MNQSKDLQLIEEVLNGNTQAFSKIVDIYKDLVFTLALRLVKKKDLAEEVAQDTFIKMYKSLSKFKGKSKFSSWVYRITYNTSLDELRRQKSKFDEISLNDTNEHYVKSDDSLVQQMETKELNTSIQKCLDVLPGDVSFLLTLFYFEELSLKEISEIVKQSPNTVKVKIHRGRQKLMGILKQNIEPEIIARYEKRH
jgi:RNA polymerase sigma-70 factor (ECF subfamily)